MIRSLLAAALALAVILPVYAAPQPGGMGWVDMQRVLEQSRLGQRLQAQLRKEFEPQARALAEAEQEIQLMRAQLERDQPLMSNEQLSKHKKEIDQRINAYEKQAEPLQKQLMERQQREGQKLIKPAREAVEQVAKRMKLGWVVEPGTPGLMYLAPSLEITDAVIKQVDANLNQ